MIRNSWMRNCALWIFCTGSDSGSSQLVSCSNQRGFVSVFIIFQSWPISDTNEKWRTTVLTASDQTICINCVRNTSVNCHLSVFSNVCVSIFHGLQWNCIPVPGLGITSFRRPRHSQARKWQGRDGSGNRIHKEMDRINRSIRLNSNWILMFYFLFQVTVPHISYNVYK